MGSGYIFECPREQIDDHSVVVHFNPAAYGFKPEEFEALSFGINKLSAGAISIALRQNSVLVERDPTVELPEKYSLDSAIGEILEALNATCTCFDSYDKFYCREKYSKDKLEQAEEHSRQEFRLKR